MGRKDRGTEGLLHIRCGDDLRELLAAAVPGDYLGIADPICQGPLPAGLEEPALLTHRATWLARRLGLAPAEVLARLTADAARLAEARDYEELVLWFEHDLHDQATLIYLLPRLWPRAQAGQRVSLICIDRHPTVPRFIGLAQLDGAALADLFAHRQTVTAAAFELAATAWQALTAPEPEALVRLVGTGCPALPFLAAALDRHLRQFPWRADGLALTEWLSLDVIDLGVRTPAEVFRHVSAREPAPWLGDQLFYPWLRDLAQGPAPLVTIAGGGSGGEGRGEGGGEGGGEGEGNDTGPAAGWPEAAELALTADGRRVLLGRAHIFDLRPQCRRWLGGVHLRPETPRWVWDANAETLIRLPGG